MPEQPSPILPEIAESVWNQVVTSENPAGLDCCNENSINRISLEIVDNSGDLQVVLRETQTTMPEYKLLNFDNETGSILAQIAGSIIELSTAFDLSSTTAQN